jgi:SpoU rRNA methylase family enzyme
MVWTARVITQIVALLLRPCSIVLDGAVDDVEDDVGFDDGIRGGELIVFCASSRVINNVSRY